MSEKAVIVLGGGIAGLTSAALLAQQGLEVILLEAHHQFGGCAGTFRRGPYVFDVGATQVAGLEPGGIHERLFKYLNLSLPAAKILDPGCSVDLLDGLDPIHIWHDPRKWEEERQRQFPGSERFWRLCSLLHASNWSFASRDPILPISNFWDFKQLSLAFRLKNLSSAIFSTLTISDLLKLSGSENNQRLKNFLDLQVRLYSQEFSDRTSALYGATALHMAQSPLGLWHLQGSMQILSDKLTESLIKNGAKLLLRHRVVSLDFIKSKALWKVNFSSPGQRISSFQSCDVVSSLTPQALVNLFSVDSEMPRYFKNRIENLPPGNAAFVFYGAISRKNIPQTFSSHIQLAIQDPGSLFISISQEGDGRAPLGQATFIASIFTKTEDWCNLPEALYQKRKEIILIKILDALEKVMNIKHQDWLHKELATPRSFQFWTGRPNGIVGGIGQHPMQFGVFGLPSRTPMRGLWLCGDSIYPGEGTAGVSQSAYMVCRQLMASRGIDMKVPD